MVLDDPAGAWPVSWSPDGASILIVTNSPKTGNDIWTLSLAGDRTPKAYQRTEASENWAAFSPDGRWVAFSSTAGSDVPEVYVTRFPTPGPGVAHLGRRRHAGALAPRRQGDFLRGAGPAADVRGGHARGPTA